MPKQAARVGDPTSHGGNISGPGCPTVFIGGQPAARVGDMGVCPMATPGTPPIPHAGGAIVGPGVPTVFIGGLPAAVSGDAVVCVGSMAKIKVGCPTVIIGSGGGGSAGGSSGGSAHNSSASTTAPASQNPAADPGSAASAQQAPGAPAQSSVPQQDGDSSAENPDDSPAQTCDALVRLYIDPADAKSRDDSIVLRGSGTAEGFEQKSTIADDVEKGDKLLSLLYRDLLVDGLYTLEHNPGKEGKPYAVFKDLTPDQINLLRETHDESRWPECCAESVKDNLGAFATAVAANTPGVKAMFLGAAGLCITDGDTTILVDPYFSRVPYWPTEAAIGLPASAYFPDEDAVRAGLDRAGIGSVDAIVVSHAHFDHAMDIAAVLSCVSTKRGEQTPVYGGPSALNAVLGNLCEAQESDREISAGRRRELYEMWNLHEITPYSSPDFIGRFSMDFMSGRHLSGFLMPAIGGTIDRPLPLPATISDYNVGEVYNVVLKHPDCGSIFIMGSANYVDGQLRGKVFDTVFTGVAGLSYVEGGFAGDGTILFGDKFDEFYDNVVGDAQPGSVYLTHWDDFGKNFEKKVEWFTNPVEVHKWFMNKFIYKTAKDDNANAKEPENYPSRTLGFTPLFEFILLNRKTAP